MKRSARIPLVLLAGCALWAGCSTTAPRPPASVPRSEGAGTSSAATPSATPTAATGTAPKQATAKGPGAIFGVWDKRVIPLICTSPDGAQLSFGSDCLQAAKAEGTLALSDGTRRSVTPAIFSCGPTGTDEPALATQEPIAHSESLDVGFASPTPMHLGVAWWPANAAIGGPSLTAPAAAQGEMCRGPHAPKSLAGDPAGLRSALVTELAGRRVGIFVKDYGHGVEIYAVDVSSWCILHAVGCVS